MTTAGIVEWIGKEVDVREFPIYDVGNIYTIENDYDVHWIEQDLAEVTVAGELIVSFASASNGGFESDDDVLEQAADVVFEMEDYDE